MNAMQRQPTRRSRQPTTDNPGVRRSIVPIPEEALRDGLATAGKRRRVNVLPSARRRRIAAPLLALLAAGCITHQHTVGLGATGTGEMSERQFYFLFGLVQVNEVDAQRMAPDLTSYTIDTRMNLLDVVLAPLLLPLTITTRTVTVRT
jgi:hypothetical protein